MKEIVKKAARERAAQSCRDRLPRRGPSILLPRLINLFDVL